MTEQPPAIDPHREARDLWDALNLGPNDQVSQAMLIGKVVDFATGRTSLTISVTDGVDWIDQLGILAAAGQVMDDEPLSHDDDSDEG